MYDEKIVINSNLYNIEHYEKFLSWKDKQPNYLTKGIEYNPQNNVVALQTFEDGFQEVYFAKNLAVITGTQYYVELINQDTVTNAFGFMQVGNPATEDTISSDDDYSDFITPVVASLKAIDGTYPQRDDPDVNNPGLGEFIFTWRTTWTAGDFDTESANTIKNGVITPPAPSGTDPLLTHWEFTSPFTKLSTSSLVVWVNHSFAGV